MSGYQKNLYPNQNYEFSQAILEKLKDALHEARITQADLGKHLDLSQNAVSCLLRGQTKMTLELFIKISELLSLKPQELFNSAEALMAKELKLSSEQTKTLYASPAHLLACCAATREIAPFEIAVGQISLQEAQSALNDLVKADLLIKKGERYIQKHPQSVYIADPDNQHLVEACHRQAMLQSWEGYEILRKNPGYRKKRFNAALIDRFTDVQREELKQMLFRVYDRIQTFRKENMLKAYQTEEDMQLLHLHLMMTTPLDSEDLS